MYMGQISVGGTRVPGTWLALLAVWIHERVVGFRLKHWTIVFECQWGEGGKLLWGAAELSLDFNPLSARGIQMENSLRVWLAVTSFNCWYTTWKERKKYGMIQRMFFSTEFPLKRVCVLSISASYTWVSTVVCLFMWPPLLLKHKRVGLWTGEQQLHSRSFNWPSAKLKGHITEVAVLICVS